MTTEQVASLVAILAALAGLVAAITQLVLAIRGLHAQINSRMDQLLASNMASGVAQGVAEEQSRAAAGQPSTPVATDAAQLAGRTGPVALPGPPSAQVDSHKRPVPPASV